MPSGQQSKRSGGACDYTRRNTVRIVWQPNESNTRMRHIKWVVMKSNDSKLILDACCGSRMFWFDKDNPISAFGDGEAYQEIKYCPMCGIKLD